MFFLPPCVSIELSAPAVAASNSATLEGRCDAILGEGRCRVVRIEPAASQPWTTCWVAEVTASGDAPQTAAVRLRDPGHPDRYEVRRSVEFRPRDAVAERWATLGLLIAALVTIEEHSATQGSTPGTPDAAPDHNPDPGPPTIAVTPPAPPPKTPYSNELRAMALVASGMVPRTAWGVRAEATFGGQHLVAAGRFSYLPSDSFNAPGNPLKGGTFQFVAGGIGGCWTNLTTRRLGARICAGGDLNVTQARGFGIADPTGTTATWGAGWVGLGAQLRLLSHALLVAGLEGTVGVSRPRFTIEGVGRLYTPPAVGGYAFLGLSVPY